MKRRKEKARSLRKNKEKVRSLKRKKENMRSLKRKRQKKSGPQKAALTRAMTSSGDDLHKMSKRRVGNPEGL